jgi:hypothetical protein
MGDLKKVAGVRRILPWQEWQAGGSNPMPMREWQEVWMD